MITPMEPLKRKQPKLGLTWRVIALSSLLLLGLTSIFTILGRDNLLRQFDEARHDHHDRQEREIRQALSQSVDSLREIAALAASSSHLGKALEENNVETITKTLSPEWPTMQLEAGIDELMVLNRDGQVLAQWGKPQIKSHLPIDEWGDKVIAAEMPISTLHCSINCRQYVAVPILSNGKSLGSIIISRSLADVTRHVRKVSTSDVALLIKGLQPLGETEENQIISAWNSQLVTLTNQKDTLPLLHQAAYQRSLEKLQDNPLRIPHLGKKFELSTIDVKSNRNQATDGYFLLISDITEKINSINRDTHSILLTGLSGWISAELMLLAILWKPMSRVRRLAAVLPMLAKGGFTKARNAIPTPKRRLSDEIDLLDATALELATQLETLQKEVQSRGELLTARVEELGQERDFIESLLDTAHVLILTQDDNGRISLVNEFCRHILGQPHDVIIGQRFEALFVEQYDNTTFLTEERLLRISGCEQRTIAWYHAPLASHGNSAMTTISVGIDITDRKAAESRLSWLASRDPLTELYNRRAFQETLEQALASERTGAVLFMDLDHFKDVNELSGHHAGDELLRLVANNLQEEIGKKGMIARLGGDEFSVLLEGSDEKGAIEVAENLSNILDATSILLSDGHRHRAVASIGIACYPIHGCTPTELMANADVAMYKAKASSLQRWYILSTLDEAKHELQQRVYWVERLRSALQNNEFELMVQPIVRLHDRDVRHYEVLIRLRGDDGELISPAHFIPVAECSGQIVQLDRWVLHQSLKLLKSVQSDGIYLSVNLSGQSLHDPDINQFLESELKESNADPHQLILEVTETAAVTDFSTAQGVLQGFRELGCRTALDDFGVGFSSFYYLDKLPVDFIKIDGSFIRSLNTDYKKRIIVKAITDIANGFGIKAIAECVEEESQITTLESFDIMFGQGFHFGKPKIATQFFNLNNQQATHER